MGLLWAPPAPQNQNQGLAGGKEWEGGGTSEDVRRTGLHALSAWQSSGAQHAHEERRKPPYPCSVFDLVDPQLHGHVKAVQDVSAEHQTVYGGVDCMDPAWHGAEKTGSAMGPTYASVQEGAGGPEEHLGPGHYLTQKAEAQASRLRDHCRPCLWLAQVGGHAAGQPRGP